MENKCPAQKMLFSHVHISDGSDMKLFLVGCLKMNAFGKSTLGDCNFSIAFHAFICGRMVGKELGRHCA